MTEKRRKRYHPPAKPFNFVPNKTQLIMGAFLDLARPIGRKNEPWVAARIASFYNEDI